MIRNLSIGALLAAAMMTAAPGVVHATKPAPLAGTLSGQNLWAAYRQRFIKPSGRVVDNANKNISHSEGQGYAMIMAVAAEDRETFARLWEFARSHLQVRDDALLAWRWKPGHAKPVSDKNNASDGDLLIAWALLEAQEAGFGDEYRAAASAILADLKPLVQNHRRLGPWIRPGSWGFSAKDHKGSEIINLSYWVFPALERLTAITGDETWGALARTGPLYLRYASANRVGLPPDWSSLSPIKASVTVSTKFGTDYSYNAIRVPLYLAWSDQGNAETLRPFARKWMGRKGGLARIDVTNGRVSGRFADKGYGAVAAVVSCALEGRKFPLSLRHKLDTFYYPASLQILSVIAIKQRYPQCW